MKTKIAIYLLFCAACIAGCKDEKDLAGPLKAAFDADKISIAAGDTVTFTDVSTGMPSRLRWTFEGASPDTSILSSPSIVYPAPGVYKVSLIASRGGTSSEETKEGFITVGYNALAADFAASDTVVYLGDEVTFTDKTKGIVNTWNWTFTPADGQATLTADGKDPVIKFTSIGIYTVKLAVSNPEYSSEKVKEAFVKVLDPNDLQPKISANHFAAVEGGTVTFQDASMGRIESWKWEFEGADPAVSTEQNPTVTYAHAGRYKVKLTISNESVSRTIEREQAIQVIPGQDLALFMPFDGDQNDLSANALPVNANGGNPDYTQTDRFGVSGFGAGFAGNSGLVIPDNAAFNFGIGDYTVAMWVKTNQTSRMMLWQESGKNGSNDNQTWLRLGDNTTDRKMRFDAEDPTGGFIVNSDASVTDNRWHQVVCVRNGLKSSVYVDGVLVKDGSTTSVKDVSNTGDFKIAFQEGASSFSNYFKGQVDDLIIYRRALTAQEVRALFGL